MRTTTAIQTAATRRPRSSRRCPRRNSRPSSRSRRRRRMSRRLATSIRRFSRRRMCSTFRNSTISLRPRLRRSVQSRPITQRWRRCAMSQLSSRRWRPRPRGGRRSADYRLLHGRVVKSRGRRRIRPMRHRRQLRRGHLHLADRRRPHRHRRRVSIIRRVTRRTAVEQGRNDVPRSGRMDHRRRRLPDLRQRNMDRTPFDMAQYLVQGQIPNEGLPNRWVFLGPHKGHDREEAHVRKQKRSRHPRKHTQNLPRRAWRN